MSQPFWGALILLVAGLLNAGFAIPMRYNRKWKWENTWLSYSVFSLTVFPWLLVALFVKRASELFNSLALPDVAPALVCGFLWGICQVMFGIAIDLLGISVVLPVVGAFSIVLGALTPAIAQHPQVMLGKLGLILFSSAALLVAGLVFYGRAARIREKPSGSKRSSRGLALAICAGILGSALNVGFASSREIVHRAGLLGNSPTVSTYAVWAILLAAGFLPNLLFCLYLARKNDSARLFMLVEGKADFLRSVLMAVMWILATTFYGISATFLGTYGTSIGYLSYGSLSIFFANVLGWKVGEWRGAPRQALTTFWAAMGLVLASVAVLGLTA